MPLVPRGARLGLPAADGVSGRGPGAFAVPMLYVSVARASRLPGRGSRVLPAAVKRGIWKGR
eukprot:7921046-Heterocapsa_arctica.AAC.1